MKAFYGWFLIFLYLPLTSMAQVNPLFGVGHRTCETWISDRGSLQEAEDGQWLSGFLSGMVAMRYVISQQNLVYKGGNPSDWIDGYCQNHQTSELQDAAVAFFFSSGRFSINSSQ